MRRLSMLVFAALFVLLLVTDRLQVWMAVIMLSVISAALLGRLFCGWVCPVNTVIEAGTWLKKRLGLADRIPVALRNPVWGYGLLVLLVGGFVVSRATGRQIPLLLLFIPLGAIIGFAASPAAWHHWMCPYNVLFRLTGARSVFSQQVSADKCNGCGLCQKECPAAAIDIVERKAVIDRAYCLQCAICSDKCPADAIGYGRQKPAVRQPQAS